MGTLLLCQKRSRLRERVRSWLEWKESFLPRMRP